MQNFSYSLPAACSTSAGVYNSSGALVRTIWAMKPETVGTHTAIWDGNDDFASPASGSPFTIKILSSNTSYVWEGVIGNTSTDLTGHTVLRSTYPPRQLFATDKAVYWALGYGEIWPATCKTSITNLNSKTWINMQPSGDYVESNFVCSDNNYVYWGASDANNRAHTFIWATRVIDDTPVLFSSGMPTAKYSSVIGYVDSPGIEITGLAVQKAGNFLFVTRRDLNQLLVLNKTTGAVVQIITINQPGQLAVDSSDNLWMNHDLVIEQYTLNASGVPVSTGVTIPVTVVGGLAVNNAAVLIADLDLQQVRAYTLKGAPLWTLGTGIGYDTDARVQNDKFYWADIRDYYKTFLCFLPDGSFLVGDGQNWRIQHFAADRSFIESISYLGNAYSVSVDSNNPQRIFSMFLEFQVDYSKPLAFSWKLVNNWLGACPNQYVNKSAISNPITLSNGRTYGFLTNGPSRTVVELIPGGALRFTPVVFKNQNYNPVQNYIESDGSLVNLTETAGFSFGTQFQFKRYLLTGFDVANNPLWAMAPITLTTTPPVNKNSVKGNTGAIRTASGNYIHFDQFKASSPVTDPLATGQGYHVGAIPEGATDYKWGSAQSTNRDSYSGPYPGQGNNLGHYFDSGNGVNYPGGFVAVSGDHVIWSYHGEGWKGGQLNKYVHIYDKNIGLPAGSFGTNIYLYPNNTNDVGNQGQGRLEAIPEGAGNALFGQMCKVNGVVYLWHGDENYHGGLHRWRIDNLDSVSVQIATAPVPEISGLDLLAGLVRGSVFADGSGWKRFPATDFNNATGKMICSIGNKNYDPQVSPNLSIVANIFTPTGSVFASRSLGNSVSLPSWSFTTDVLYDSNIPSDNPKHGQMLEILDKTGLRIVQFYTYLFGKINQVKVNGKIIAQGANPSQELFDLINNYHCWTRLSVSVLNGILTVSYGNYLPVIVPVLDPGADMNFPDSLRLYFFTTGTVVQGNGMSIAIQNAKFKS